MPGGLTLSFAMHLVQDWIIPFRCTHRSRLPVLFSGPDNHWRRQQWDTYTLDLQKIYFFSSVLWPIQSLIATMSIVALCKYPVTFVPLLAPNPGDNSPKLPIPVGISSPSNNGFLPPSQLSKRHLDQNISLATFAGHIRVINRQTDRDHATCDICINRPHICAVRAMRLNKFTWSGLRDTYTSHFYNIG